MLDQRTGSGEGVGSTRPNREDAFVRRNHVAVAGQQKRRLLVGDEKEGFEMAQHLVGAPLFAQLDRSTLEIPVVLLEFAFEPREQREGVARGARKPRNDLVVVEAAHLFGAGFHHRLTQRDLAVSGESHTSIFSYQQHGCAAHSIAFLAHASLMSTIGTRSNVSQGRHLKRHLGYHCCMYKRPRIGIPMRIELPTDRFYLSRHYSEAVEAAGGAPVHISLIPKRDYVEAVVEGLDGILLPGSDSDVDPLRYGQEPHPNLGAVHPIKDETDLLLIEAAERKGIPIFAICFGMQALNVSRGGTLIQDIGSQLPEAIKHEQGVPRDRPSHRITLAEGTKLSGITGAEPFVANSHHHQAVETLGADLVATAWTTDGIIEALEDPRPDRFIVAVQWHPELGWARDEISQRLFKAFVMEAAKATETAGAVVSTS